MANESNTSHTYSSVFAPDTFAGQSVIVTGGGSGIGRCTAHELASLGAQVALVGRNEEKLNRVREEISEDGGAAIAVSGDIRQPDDVAQFVARVLDEYGRIDGLVNNAGGQFRAPLEEISPNGFRAVVMNNLVGGYTVMREVYLKWMKHHGGSMVNIVADMWEGWPTYGHSGAARAGMKNLTETAAAEWGHSGVRINAVAPGLIASSGLDTYPEKDLPYVLRDLRGDIPLQRMGTEAEVSAAITFLLSPGASFISGSTIRVDGAAPNGARTWEIPPVAANNDPYDGFHRSVVPEVLAARSNPTE